MVEQIPAADRGRRTAINAVSGVHAGPYSHAIQIGDLLFTSGQIGLDPKTSALVGGGFEAEARQVFENLRKVLEAACLSFNDVVKCNVYVTDVANFSALNQVYGAQFEEPFPARTTVVVAALPLKAQVEVEMIAALKAGT